MPSSRLSLELIPRNEAASAEATIAAAALETFVEADVPLEERRSLERFRE